MVFCPYTITETGLKLWKNYRTYEFVLINWGFGKGMVYLEAI